ncbi:hypothetical protein OEA41_010639 [Lepraria neglecta]|uniref:Uncharacterized protein n=1 Tax=Lepraria neglecta TaxID=209136 RepID=A0AAD9Z063_9LECA|nr:hypothetical protein OEA41_010639 [Lepraria neglecta]
MARNTTPSGKDKPIASLAEEFRLDDSSSEGEENPPPVVEPLGGVCMSVAELGTAGLEAGDSEAAELAGAEVEAKALTSEGAKVPHDVQAAVLEL